MPRPGTGQEIPSQTGRGNQADSPLELDPPDWKTGVRRAAKEFKDDHGTLTAAGMAFYWFLGVFPALLAAVGVLGLVNAGDEAARSITKGIEAALPGDAAQVLTSAVDRAVAQSGGAALVATLVGLAVALWSASAGMVAMQMGLDIAYDVGEERSFVKKRLVAVVLLVATAVLGGVATGLIVFGAPLGDALRDNLPFGSAFGPVWTALRFGLGLLALVLLFATFFYLAPNRDSPKWAWVSPGGVLATAIWLLASLGFSIYVSRFGSYAETYGSLSGVVVLLLWLFLSAIAVVFGGELNAELERRSAVQAGHVPSGARGGDRGATAGGDDQQRAPAPASSDGEGVEAAWAQRMRELRSDDEVGAGGRARSSR